MNDRRFIQYLQQELGIAESAIALASRGQDAKVTELPVSLWNYGLIDLDQLSQIFDWIERVS
ncbi:MAG: DUF2949 domain-containing protein [Thermosynechococcaceae cyanobacterium]